MEICYRLFHISCLSVLRFVHLLEWISSILYESLISKQLCLVDIPW